MPGAQNQGFAACDCPPAMKTELRRACLEDLPAICLLADEVHAIHHQAEPATYREAPDRVEVEAFWRGLLENAESVTYLAEREGEALGFVTLVLGEERSAFTVPLRFAKILSICVAGRFRRQGIGHQLLAQADAWAASHGVAETRLNVWAFNRAAANLYQRHGYAVRWHSMAKPVSPR